MPIQVPAASEPCPCPSARTFGDCHGAHAVTEDARRSAVLNAVDDRLADLVRALKIPQWRPRPRRHKHPRLHWQLDANDYVSFAIKQIAFGERDASGRTRVDFYIAKEGRKLKEVERKLLEAQRRARTAIWRIARVVPGDGLELTSVRTGERVFVYEAGFSSMFIGSEGHAMLARIIEVDGISIASGLHLGLLTDLPPEVIETSASDVEALEGMWERAIEKHTRPDPALLRDSDGCALAPSRDHYRMDPADEEAVILALRTISESSVEVGSSVHTMVVYANPPEDESERREVEGRVAFAFDRLIVEAASSARADRLRQRVESACGSLIRRERREDVDLGRYFDRLIVLPSVGPEWTEELTPDLRATLLRKTELLQQWIETPHRWLFGRTPHEATQSVRGRSRLHWMLDKLVTLESTLRPESRVDIAAFKKALGLDSFEVGVYSAPATNDREAPPPAAAHLAPTSSSSSSDFVDRHIRLSDLPVPASAEADQRLTRIMNTAGDIVRSSVARLQGPPDVRAGTCVLLIDQSDSVARAFYEHLCASKVSAVEGKVRSNVVTVVGLLHELGSKAEAWYLFTGHVEEPLAPDEARVFVASAQTMTLVRMRPDGSRTRTSPGYRPANPKVLLQAVACWRNDQPEGFLLQAVFASVPSGDRFLAHYVAQRERIAATPGLTRQAAEAELRLVKPDWPASRRPPIELQTRWYALVAWLEEQGHLPDDDVNGILLHFGIERDLADASPTARKGDLSSHAEG